MPKFLITQTSNENQYCRAVAKAVDNTLVDADFDFHTMSIGTGQLANTLAYMSQNYNAANMPILIYPTPLAADFAKAAFDKYPDILVVGAFHDALPNQPHAITLTPNRVPHFLTVAGGLAGLSDWGTGPGIEFVEEGHILYLNSGVPVTTFPITNITNLGGGIAKIFAAELNSWANVGELIHIENSTGLQNNPNGKYRVLAKVTGGVTITFEVGTGSFTSVTCFAKIHYNSGAVASAAAKIHKISRTLGCTFGVARKIAQATGSESGTRSDTKGYGEINLAAALAYSGSVPVDSFDLLGAIQTLTLVVNDYKATFTMPEVLNSRQVQLFDNAKLAYTQDMEPGETFSHIINPYKLGTRNYIAKALRDASGSNNSNIVSTTRAALQGRPSVELYPEGSNVVYWNGGTTLASSHVVKILLAVGNPGEDAKGIQINEYVLADGKKLDENSLFASAGDALFNKTKAYLNQNSIAALQLFELASYDQCGMDYRGTDFTLDGDYDFTGMSFSNTNFEDAIIPAVYQDEAGRQFFIDNALFVNLDTVIWVTGKKISVELDA